MTTLPPSPFTDSALEPAMAADTAAAPDLTDPPVAATDSLDDTDCIGEIFAHARKLCAQAEAPFDPDAITAIDELLYIALKAKDRPQTRDIPIPDVAAFMAAIEDCAAVFADLTGD